MQKILDFRFPEPAAPPGVRSDPIRPANADRLTVLGVPKHHRNLRRGGNRSGISFVTPVFCPPD